MEKTEESLHSLMEAQRQYYLKGCTKNINMRLAYLKKLEKEIKRNSELIVRALKDDFNKPEFEAYTTEIMPVLDDIALFLKKLPAWSGLQRVKTPIKLMAGSSGFYYNPYGVALVIGTWNYPFNLTMLPVVGAIAAGNCCIVKTSKQSPNTGRIIKRIVEDIFPKEHCAVLESNVSEKDLLKERFDFIFYTGSTAVGHVIAEAAAKHLTPVVLELGGKSPCIIDETAELDSTARRIVWGKFTNAGQTCVAPDYILVHRSIKPSLIEALKKAITAHYGELLNDWENAHKSTVNSDYARIIHERAFQRLEKYIEYYIKPPSDSANIKGTIVFGGKTYRESLTIYPTIIDNVQWEDPIMKEEIFGPILPIIEYEDLETTLEILKQKEKTLALYLFSKRKEIQRKVLRELDFGGCCINGTLLHTANSNLPFGGIGHSGMGDYHGRWSFEAFSHKKAVFKKTELLDFSFIYPPYKNKAALLKKWLFGLNQDNY